MLKNYLGVQLPPNDLLFSFESTFILPRTGLPESRD